MREPMHTLMIKVTAFEKSIPEFKSVAERDAYRRANRRCAPRTANEATGD